MHFLFGDCKLIYTTMFTSIILVDILFQADSGRRMIKPSPLRGSMDMVDDFYTLTQCVK